MKREKLILLIIIGITAVATVIFIAVKLLSRLDVVATGSLDSFKAVTKQLEDKITFDNKWNSWALNAPDGSVTFYFSKDFSKSSFHDVMLEFEAKPFIDAGMNTNKMPNNSVLNGMIMVGVKLGEEKITYDSEATPYRTYSKIVQLKRDIIKYHAALDHYGIDLGDGNMFEWAKDMSTNDKDIVFALNPEKFIKAGVNPKKVEGWLYAKVPTMKDGKKIEVYKFIKAFNIK
jgi:hypothetical protein